MKLALTTRERLGISAIMTKASWGGSPELLMAQASLYEALDLASLAGLAPAVVAKLARSLDQTLYEFPPEAGEVLLSVLAAGGQNAELGMISVGILRRFDPVRFPPASAAPGTTPPNGSPVSRADDAAPAADTAPS